MATNPMQYPLGLPSVSGTTVTLDVMLQEPTRITRFLSDLTLANLFANRIYATPGGVTGGGLLYDQLTTNELYTSNDVQHVEPGAEFPIVNSTRTAPKFAPVEKFGGKFFITDEARDRNDETTFRQQATKLANTIVRKVNARAIAELDTALTAIGSPVTATGVNWGAVVTAGTSASSNAAYPAADFAKVQLLADTAELGVVYDLWIVNPAQMSAFQVVYGNAWREVLATWGVEMISSNRVAAGTAYALESGMVGEMRLEKPLGTETWREQETERTWVQSSVRPVYAVTNPYSAAKVTGLAG